MDNVLEGRQAPADIPEIDLRAALERIVTLFNERWLLADSPYALQRLWKRRDMTATWELFWLGSSLDRLATIKSGWLADQINVVKTGQRNQRIGSLFELLALALFAGPDHAVVPGKKNQPGYDGTLLFKDGNVARISLKNFARSGHQRDFNTNATSSFAQIHDTLHAHPRQWAGIAAFSETYPKPADWRVLREHLARRITNGNTIGSPSEQVGPWSIVYTSPPNDASLHGAYTSHTFQVVAKHHENEAKNVEDSLAKAFANFDRHVAKSARGSTNILLIRLGEAFFVPALADWIRTYLAGGKTHIDEILLYQPAIALDRMTSGTTLMHHMTMVKVGDAHHPTLSASAPVGVIAAMPTRTVLIAGPKEITLQDYHLFQRGNVYVAGMLELGVESPLKIDFGPGIIAHNVLHIMGDVDGIVLSPRHPLSWELSLLND